MAQSEAETEAAIARLSDVLPRLAPEVWTTLNPPASEDDIADLVDAVAPYPLPLALRAWLRFADGQTPGREPAARGWPSIVGPGWMIPAARMADTHRQWLSHSPPGLLRFADDSGSTHQIELIDSRTPMVFSNFVHYSELEVAAPSFGAFLSGAADVVEAELLDHAGVLGDDYPAMIAHRSQQQAVLDAVYAERGWADAPFPPGSLVDTDEFLSEWGEIPAL